MDGEEETVTVNIDDAFIIKSDTDELCRLCANTDNQLIPIFKGEGLEHNIPNIIEQHLPIVKVTELDKLPLQICYQCASTLIAWHNLYEGCQIADMKLREIFLISDKLYPEDEALTEYVEDYVNDFNDHSQDDYQTLPFNDTVNTSDNPADEILINSHLENTQLTVTQAFDETEEDIPNERYGSAENLLFVDSKVDVATLPSENDDDGVSDSEGVRSTKCAVCGSTFLKSKINSIDNRGTCYMCHAKYHKLSYKMTTDAATNRSILTKYLVTDENKQNYYQCDVCGFACEAFPDVFVHHYRSEHPNVAETVFGLEDRMKDDTGDGYERDKRPKTLAKRRTSEHNVPNVIAEPSNPAVANTESNDKLIVHRDNVFHCTACSKTYDTWTYARRHVRRVHSEKRYFCGECGRGFTFRHKAREHQRRHTKRRPYMCDVCGRRFVNKANLTSHQSKNLCAKYTCSWCDRVFYNKTTLRDHLGQCEERKYEYVMATVTTPPEDQSKYQCANCAAVFPTKAALRSHIIVENELTPYPCGICGRRFASKRALNGHPCADTYKPSVDHRDNVKFLVVVNADNTYSCKLCGKHCRKMEYVRQHLRLHSGVKPYVCQYCGKAYAVRASLTSHMLTEMNLRRYACSRCDKRYNTSSHLTAHTKKHHRLREYKCDTCDKEFAYLRDLNEHANTHKELKPYFCDKCGGFFKTERYLKIHWERCSASKRK